MKPTKKTPAPYDEKNAEDYLANTQAIHRELGWMEDNLDKLKPSQISLATLSRRTGLHRNTLSSRGKWIKERINTLKALKRTPSIDATEHEGRGEGEKKVDRVEELKQMLELQRQETGRMFLRSEHLKVKLKEAEAALKKMVEKNIALQEDNEELLKRLSGNVTSINAAQKKVRGDK